MPSLLFPSLDRKRFWPESSHSIRSPEHMVQESLPASIPSHANLDKMKRIRGRSKDSSTSTESMNFEKSGLLYDLKSTIDRYLRFAECVRRAQFTGLEYSSRYLDCLAALKYSHRSDEGIDSFLYGFAQLSVIANLVDPVRVDWTCMNTDGRWEDFLVFPRHFLSDDYGLWLDIGAALYPCHTTIATDDVCVQGLSESTPVSLLQYQMRCSKAAGQRLGQGSTHQMELHTRADVGSIESPPQKTRLFRRHNSTKAIHACIKVCNEHRNSSANRIRIGPGPNRVDSIDYSCPMTDPETAEYCTELIDKQHQTIEIMCGVFAGSCLFAFLAIVLRLLQESRGTRRLESVIRQPRNTPNESRAESGPFSSSIDHGPIAPSTPNETIISKAWYTRPVTGFFHKSDPTGASAPALGETHGPPMLEKPPKVAHPPSPVPTIVVDRVRTRSRASHASADSLPPAKGKDDKSKSHEYRDRYSGWHRSDFKSVAWSWNPFQRGPSDQ